MDEEKQGLLRRIWRSRFIQSLISDEQFYKIKYRVIVGEKLDLKNPRTLSEKLQWLKLHDRKEGYRQMVDKVAVQDYVKEKLGAEYLIPQYGVYESFKAIDFETLPNQFVLKPNHTSGDIFYCSDKSKLDLVSLEKTVTGWIQRDYYPIHREWPYKGIKPLIICQQYLRNKSGAELIDYKLRCFNGETKVFSICSERNSQTGMKVDYLDQDWKLLPYTRNFPNSGKKQPKPKNFDKMVAFANILAKDLAFIRIDFYEVDEKLYFGEITFYPASGHGVFQPERYAEIYGDLLVLPEPANQTKAQNNSKA